MNRTASDPPVEGLILLEDVSRLVTHSHNLDEILTHTVDLVADRTGADVCSLYLLDDTARALVLRATRGLHPASVGKIRLPVGEGLVTLPVETLEPVAVADAAGHPRFRFFPGSGEEAYRSLLAVPLVLRGVALGSLVIQTRRERQFRPEEIQLLSTLASQLAGIVESARLWSMVGPQRGAVAVRSVAGMGADAVSSAPGPDIFHGSACAAGIATGPVLHASRPSSPKPSESFDRDDEMRRLREAIGAGREGLARVHARVAQDLGEETGFIFAAQLMILEDTEFIDAVTLAVGDGNDARGAVDAVARDYIGRFRAFDDPYLAERAADVEDVRRRLIRHLEGGAEEAGADPVAGRIIVDEHISPSEVFAFASDGAVGLISEHGAAGSHAAILARSLSIPMVGGVHGITTAVSDGDLAIIDGDQGIVATRPRAAVVEEFRRLEVERRMPQEDLDGLRVRQAATRDGRPLPVLANVNLLADARRAAAAGAEGIGLYRSEIPFLVRRDFPSEEEQVRIYSRIVRAVHPLPVTIRTLDIGGDKFLPHFPGETDPNPFLGYRSIRVSLDHPETFRLQIRAILRALAEADGSRLLLPMITSIDDLRRARALIEEASAELDRAGRPYARSVPVGAMIEVPAAVEILPALSRHADFFSIGTNDLLQFLLAADRTNDRVTPWYDAAHPAVWSVLGRIVAAAHAADRSVSICGELASDPLCLLPLIGSGVDTLSVNTGALPMVKRNVFLVDSAHARSVFESARCAEDAASVRDAFRAAARDAGIRGSTAPANPPRSSRAPRTS